MFIGIRVPGAEVAEIGSELANDLALGPTARNFYVNGVHALGLHLDPQQLREVAVSIKPGKTDKDLDISSRTGLPMIGRGLIRIGLGLQELRDKHEPDQTEWADTYFLESSTDPEACLTVAVSDSRRLTIAEPIAHESDPDRLYVAQSRTLEVTPPAAPGSPRASQIKFSRSLTHLTVFSDGRPPRAFAEANPTYTSWQAMFETMDSLLQRALAD
jgi:hypothetical protein